MMPRSVTTTSSGMSQADGTMRFDLLAGEGETDEPWPPPAARSVAQVAQRTIVVAGAHAEAIAVPVESDDRHQHRVETAMN